MLLTVQYDGAGFHGWQLQPDRRTIQGELEQALSRLADRPCTALGSGRTDSGVHALGQVAAADVPSKWSPEELCRALNAILPEDVWIDEVLPARPDFHPRYDAVSRTYTYDVGLDRRAESPFHRRWCWALGEPLDIELLDAGAGCVIGPHSFESFSKAGQPERGEMCTVAAAAWAPWSLGLRFTITADRYLHHMVRYLVGTMVDVARGRRPAADVVRLLEKEPEVVTSPPAPPHGLFLSHVEYPEHVLLGPRQSTRSPRRTATV
jgi:tRNA pseudouridine38-40 synthase